MKHILTRLLAAIVIATIAFGPATAQANETEVGRWSDEINHITSRGITVISTGDGPALIVLETAFGPNVTHDLRLSLGKDGVLSHDADLGALAIITGLQVFEAPVAVDLDAFNELHIWNAVDGTSIGVAPLG